MNEHETIADIRKDAEAKFRELVEAYIQRRAAFQTTVGAMQAFNTVFDRFDAAHRRERGNAAKLREALAKVIEIAEREWDAFRGTPAMWEIHEICKAALAAPPRNCDRFGSSTQARAEWYKTEVLPRVEGVVSGVEPPFVDWLLAPATEKEGGAK